MARASFAQSSFLGGEWGPYYQGRFDNPKYRTAMSLCFNSYPITEGAVARRSGTQHYGTTRAGAPGRVLPFDVTEVLPYVLEFTDGHLRIWNGSDLVLGTDVQPVTSISSTTPAVVNTGAQTWVTGDSVEFLFQMTDLASGSPYLRNRVFEITAINSNQFTLHDAITGAAINGALIAWSPTTALQVGRVIDFPAPWTNGEWDTMRVIQDELEALLLWGGAPQALIMTSDPNAGRFATFTLETAEFLDGPYLDAPVGASLAPNGINEIFNNPTNYRPWDPNVSYTVNSFVLSNGAIWQSLQNQNLGIQPVSGSSWWTQIVVPTAPPNYSPWNPSVIYPENTIVTYNGVGYESEQDGNINNQPDISPGFWIVTTAQIIYTIAYQVWSAGLSYPQKAFVTFNGGDYQSIQDGNINNEPDVSPTWWKSVTLGAAWGPGGVQQSDIGRAVRILNQPPPWDPLVTYAPGAAVTWEGNFYLASTGSTDAQPDLSPSDWGLSPTAGQWNWGIVTSVPSNNQFTLQLQDFVQGDTQYLTPIVTWTVGAYGGSSAKYPTCGTYYEGRLYLAGAYENRWDAGMTGQPSFLYFSPTAPDGTVADNYGISYTFNSNDQNPIFWMYPGFGGLVAGTQGGEWLIQASALNDPITPTSAQAHRVTKYGCANLEPVGTGLSLVFVQKHQRQVLEFISDVFSGRFSAPELSLAAKHLTVNQIKELTYNIELAPIIWMRKGDGSLAGTTYRRISSFSTEEPAFVGWHQHSLGSNRAVISICASLTPDATLPNLVMVTTDGTVCHVEAMQPLFDQGDTIYDAWFVDDAVCPPAATVAADQSSITYYGLHHLEGKTVSVFSCGLDTGDFAVSNGRVTVPFAAPFTLANLEAIAGLGLTFSAGSPLDVSTVVPPPPPAIPGSIVGYGLTMPGWSTLPLVPNWASGTVYITLDGFGSQDGIWAFNIDTGALQASASATSLGTVVSHPSTMGTDGKLYASNGSGGILKGYTPAPSITTAASLAVPIGPPQTIASVSCGTDNFIVCGSAIGGSSSICVLTLSPTLADAKHVFTMSIVGLGGGAAVQGWECPGHSGPDRGQMFTLGAPDEFAGASYDLALPIYETTMLPGAGDWVTTTAAAATAYGANLTYNIGSIVTSGGSYYTSLINVNIGNTPSSSPSAWQLTTNPLISTVKRATLAPNQVDPAWTTFETVGMGNIWYDASDGNVLIGAVTQDSVAHQYQVVKVSIATGAVVWSAVLSGGELPITNNLTRVSNGILVVVSGSTTNIINTATGAVTTYSIPGVSMQGQAFDGVSGNLIGLTTFSGSTSGAPSPVPASGTAISFSGEWAMVNLGGRFQGNGTVSTRYIHPCVIGFTFTSQGQLLPPVIQQDTGAQNGPAFGKKRRIEQYAIQVAQAGINSLSIGTTISSLYPIVFKDDAGNPIPAGTLYNGVVWDTLQNDYSFNGQIRWQVTRPLPVTITALGGFIETMDR